MSGPRVAVAWAPASVGNVGVGFDILGHSIDAGGDRVCARRSDRPGVRIGAIRGSAGLPLDAERNTAGVAAAALLEAAGADFGVELEIDKGLPLGSGMGSSAASAVAAVVAVNALLPEPLPRSALYRHALAGEAVASGGRHGDNVGPQLLGGLVLALAERLIPVPIPAGLHCALVHPRQVLETRRAREVLQAPYALGDFVRQSAALAGLLAACFRGAVDEIAGCIEDVLVEPRRAALIPGFTEARRAALDAGALGASISGAGPSAFAWCRDQASAETVAAAMQAAYAGAGVEAECWVAPVAGPAARLESCA